MLFFLEPLRPRVFFFPNSLFTLAHCTSTALVRTKLVSYYFSGGEPSPPTFIYIFFCFFSFLRCSSLPFPFPFPPAATDPASKGLDLRGCTRVPGEPNNWRGFVTVPDTVEGGEYKVVVKRDEVAEYLWVPGGNMTLPPPSEPPTTTTDEIEPKSSGSDDGEQPPTITRVSVEEVLKGGEVYATVVFRAVAHWNPEDLFSWVASGAWYVGRRERLALEWGEGDVWSCALCFNASILGAMDTYCEAA